MAALRQTAFLFDEGTEGTKRPYVRGGKGANLAEMATFGLPVAPGFTLPTSVARAFYQTDRLPRRLAWHLNRGIDKLEQATGRGFGNSDNPLLVSVRSGAAGSMPGMMDTVLNVGLNPATVEGLARIDGKRFALDSYRRFLDLFGEVVLEGPSNDR